MDVVDAVSVVQLCCPTLVRVLMLEPEICFLMDSANSL